MTLAVADVLLSCGAGNREVYIAKFQEWFRMYPFAGYGGAFLLWASMRHSKPYNLLWAHEDGLDVEDLIGQIEEHLKVKLSDEEVRGWFNLTLGEVVDILLAKKGIPGR
jgi:hypothetical protein